MQRPWLALGVGILTIVGSAAAIEGVSTAYKLSTLPDAVERLEEQVKRIDSVVAQMPETADRLEERVRKIDLAVAKMETHVEWFKARAERQDGNN